MIERDCSCRSETCPICSSFKILDHLANEMARRQPHERVKLMERYVRMQNILTVLRGG